MATFGGEYKLESKESRALSTITVESYDKDEAKTLIKLKQDVSYMASYQRKMQKGIDQANENVLEQIQRVITDVVVLLGGGDAQGFDFFGDLKYVLKAFGAVFGFSTPTKTANQATSHMAINYLASNTDFANVVYDDAATWAGTIGVDSTTVPGINTKFSNFWNGIVEGIEGWANAADQARVNATIRDQAQTIAALSAQVQELVSTDANENVGGVSAFVDMSALTNYSTPPGFGTRMYSGTGTGVWVVEDGSIRWLSAPDNPRWVIWPYTAVDFKTTYQYVAASFRTAPMWFNSTALAQNFIICRSNAAYDSYTYILLEKYRAEIGFVHAGVRHMIFEKNSFSFKSSASYGVMAGAIGNPRYLALYENGKPILDGTEPYDPLNPGLSSQITTAHIRSAIGAMAYATGLGTQRPAELIAFGMSDNQPPTTLGSTMTLTRNSGTTVNIPANASPLPASFWDNLGANSEDWAYDLVTGTLTCLRGGEVSVLGRIDLSTSMPARMDMLLYVNADPNPHWIGPTAGRMTNAGGGNEFPRAIFGAYTLNLQPNDYIRMGTNSSSGLATANTMQGSAGGKTCFFKATVTSRNLA